VLNGWQCHLAIALRLVVEGEVDDLTVCCTGGSATWP
jgi:hypothetical protein